MNKHKFKADLILVLVIITSPFVFYFYLLSPEDSQIWETSFFIIDAGYFGFIRNYLWILGYKILTILTISIWLITCKNWWRLILLIPLHFEVFRFLSFINDRFNFFEDFIIGYSLVAFIPYSLTLLLISKKLGYYSGNFKTELNNEIYLLMSKLSILKKHDFSKVKEELKKLRKNKNQIDKKEYLTKLIELRDSLSNNPS